MSHSGSWDKAVWFQDVALNKGASGGATHVQPTVTATEGQFPLNRAWGPRTVKRIFGPPGTGKTFTLVGIARDAIRSGVRPEDIGYFAFTNVAADEARDRIAEELDLMGSRFANFSTLHSLTTRMGGAKGRGLCQKVDFQRFDPNIQTRDEWLRAGDASSIAVRPSHPVLDAYGTMINRKELAPSFAGISLERAKASLDRYYGYSIPASDVPRFAANYFREYELFKLSNNLADFNDVIRTVAIDSFPSGRIPTFELLIIDEAQDLTALQWDVVSKLSERAKTTILGGDDDQAIMESFGAAPHIFNKFPTTEPDKVLPTSYRLPKNIKQFVDRLILPRLQGRPDRKHKEWTEDPEAVEFGEVISEIAHPPTESSNRPRPEPLSLGRLLRIVEAHKDEEWLIMAPTRATCAKISTGLSALKVPHFCHRQDVLGSDNRIQVQTIHTSKGLGTTNSALVCVTPGDHFLIKEDPRLHYVALTRAKKKLFIVNC